MGDDAAWSPRRIRDAVRLWGYLALRGAYVPLPYMLRWHQRPLAEHTWRKSHGLNDR